MNTNYVSSFNVPSYTMSVGSPRQYPPQYPTPAWDHNEFREYVFDRWRRLYLGEPVDEYWIESHASRVKGFQDESTRRLRDLLDNERLANRPMFQSNNGDDEERPIRRCEAIRERTLINYLDRRLTLLEWFLEFRGRLPTPTCVLPLHHGGGHMDGQHNHWPDRGDPTYVRGS